MTKSKLRTSQRPARVLIVDDHPVVREGLAMRIANHADLKVCGEAADVTEALKLAEATSPDVAIVDISLKNGNGIDLIRRLKARDSSVRVLVCSMYSEALYAERALRAGAMGFINKEHATGQIISAIRQLLAGKLYLSESMSNELLNRAVGHAGTADAASPMESLSDRELEVFQFIGQGMDTQQIAARMRLSPKTVETYRGRIKEKLHLTTGTELMQRAVQWALENG
jgi:DNA-binding NarL/FixJ family response regulator